MIRFFPCIHLASRLLAATSIWTDVSMLHGRYHNSAIGIKITT
jgi:hypothetical protein